jgi:DNA-binding MarR family transcriptional regulator
METAQRRNRTPGRNRSPGGTTIRLPCACANLRRAARVITQLYDDALRPSGLRITQFTLLQALHYAPEISQKQLAELLEIDTTTLTRTLGFLRGKGWLRSERASDRRELRLRLTAAGKREYERVLPYWHSAQNRLRLELGEADLNRVVNAAVRIAELTRKSDSKI